MGAEAMPWSAIAAVGTLIVAVVSVVGGIAGAVLYVRNTASSLRTELQEYVRTQLQESRQASEQMYAKREEITSLQATLQGMQQTLQDVQKNVRSMWEAMRKNGVRRRDSDDDFSAGGRS